MIGVAASSASQAAVLVASLAGLVAGAMSMAAGEYVSVSSQRDAEGADVDLERRQLAADPAAELAELTDIYVARGLDRKLASTVANRLTAVDPLGAHLRDELGFSEAARARPVQAGVVSAARFAVGAAATLVLLAILGAVGGRLGRAPAAPAALRVAVGGGLAMTATAMIALLVGAVGL